MMPGVKGKKISKQGYRQYGRDLNIKFKKQMSNVKRTERNINTVLNILPKLQEALQSGVEKVKKLRARQDKDRAKQIAQKRSLSKKK